MDSAVKLKQLCSDRGLRAGLGRGCVSGSLPACSWHSLVRTEAGVPGMGHLGACRGRGLQREFKSTGRQTWPKAH